jgi:hypothetical protein
MDVPDPNFNAEDDSVDADASSVSAWRDVMDRLVLEWDGGLRKE